MTVSDMAISDPASLVFGVAPKPVKCGFELTIGGGQVYPEVNFTLPPLRISDEFWPSILTHYRTIASEVLRRALALRLLAGNAPEVFTEVLAYDCRLMNEAAKRGGALTLRNWMVASDEWLSPQAAVLSPDATIEIAKAIAGAPGDYSRTVAAGRAALKILRDGLSDEKLHLNKKECQWLDRIEREFDALPPDEWTLLVEMQVTYGGLFDTRSYGLAAN